MPGDNVARLVVDPDHDMHHHRHLVDRVGHARHAVREFHQRFASNRQVVLDKLRTLA